MHSGNNPSLDEEPGDTSIDAILEDSFPASDPPSWTPGAPAGEPLRPNRVDNDN
jgi:hypothetical protein